MKMIDVLNMMAKGEIEEGTILTVKVRYNRRYIYIENYFLDEYHFRLNIYSESDLNSEVELIPPKEKKYLIKVNIQGLNEDFAYLNYSELQSYVVLDSKFDFERCRTQFTKKELKSIKPVKEFLDDMQGKYELVEWKKMSEAWDKINQLVKDYRFNQRVLDDIYNRLRDCQDEAYAKQQLRYLENCIRYGKAVKK